MHSDDDKMKAHSSSKCLFILLKNSVAHKHFAFYPYFFNKHFSVTGSSNITPRTLSANVLSALQSVRFIAQHIRDADKDNEVSTRLTKLWTPLNLLKM